MRRLSKSERRLLILFAAAVFLAANLLALRFWSASRRALAGKAVALRAQIAEDRNWLAVFAGYEAEAAWTAAHRPTPLTEDKASSRLVDLVRRSAETHGVVIASESLLPPKSAEFPSACLQIKLSGAFPGMVRLLFDLQEPGAWRAIEKLTLRGDASPADALAELEIRQFFTSGPPAESSSAP